jgi:hypothetical protein
VLNWRLLKNPMNWVVVLAMLVLAAVGGHLVLTLFGASPAGSATKLPTGYVQPSSVGQ